MRWIGISVLLIGLWVLAASLIGTPAAHFPRAMATPSLSLPLGADALGRDMWVRTGQALGVSLWVGLWASIIAVAIGTLYGATAALVGGRTDRVMMRALEVVNALPLVLFVVLVTLYIGRSIWALFIAIGAVEWTTLARVVRARLLQVRGREFIRAAQVMGATPTRILWRHLLPHTAGVVLAYAMLNLPAILILEATLSYLGLGVQPPMASLGVLLKEGAEAMTVYPWLLWVPAAAFVWMLSTTYATAEWLKKNTDNIDK